MGGAYGTIDHAHTKWGWSVVNLLTSEHTLGSLVAIESRRVVMSHKSPSDDLAVQATNDDATSCKRFAVQKGYWKDDFVKFFCRSADRKSPEINRGYFARVRAYHILVEEFLTLTNQQCQIVNLGAGFDTLYWLLHQKSILPKFYVEVDFSNITSKKCRCISTKQSLLEVLVDPVVNKDEVHSKGYVLMAGDLRNMYSLGDRMLAAGLDKSLPTMFLTECVLVYMEPERSREVIEWAGSNFTTAMFLNYEPILPSDRFGEIMQANLSQRGCTLLGINACPDLKSQRERFLNGGFSKSWALDMAEVYRALPREDTQRIERLEFLDEQELLIQLLQHYTLSCGYSDHTHIGLDKIQLQKKVT